MPQLFKGWIPLSIILINHIHLACFEHKSAILKAERGCHEWLRVGRGREGRGKFTPPTPSSTTNVSLSSSSLVDFFLSPPLYHFLSPRWRHEFATFQFNPHQNTPAPQAKYLWSVKTLLKIRSSKLCRLFTDTERNRRKRHWNLQIS